MFRFFKNKIYRAYFIKRSILLTLAMLVAFALLSERLFNAGVDAYSTDVAACGQAVQEKFSSVVQRITFFMDRIYSDEAALADFLRYFGNSAEGYLSERLDNPDANGRDTDFLRLCKEFVNEINYSVSYVIFSSEEGVANAIRYMPDGNATFRFNLTADELSEIESETTNAYIYRKTLPDPANLKVNMGEILFIINPDQLFHDTAKALPGGVFIENETGIITLQSAGLDAQTLFSMVPSDETTSGQIGENLLARYHYARYTDKQYGFTIYGFVDSQTLFDRQHRAFFSLIFFSLAAYLLFLFLLFRHLSHDDSFLSDILSSIDAAKGGKFSHTPFKKRDDVYGLIAAELNEMSDEVNAFIQSEYILKLDAERAKMRALQNQIDPHFLYNTLEIIRARALYNNDIEVSDAVANLGNLYRSIVRAKSALPLREELAILKEYVRLMEFKYPDNFFFETDIPDSMLDMMTVKLWMQPVAENFFKHGFRSDSPYNLLMVIGEETEDSCCLLFSDNGTGIREGRLAEVRAELEDPAEEIERPSIGLRNIYSRLRHFYKDNVSVSIYNNETAGITVRFTFKKPLPFYKEESLSCTDC